MQPFLVLARGLAEGLGWLITIVAEERYRVFINENSNVSRGAIRWRPTGGDTLSEIDAKLAK